MRYVILSSFVFMALFVSISAYAVEVEISDHNLEAVIRDKLNKPEGTITDTNLQSITQLDTEHDWQTTDDEKIVDLAGLEYCTNLTKLYLDYNQIDDISVLSNLTNMTELSLGGNPINDISALSTLRNLIVLSLYYNQIADISALSNLTNLTVLVLGNNQITDISALSTLTNLTVLFLYDNPITDISALSNFTNLTELYLSDNQIKDLQPLVANPGIDLGDEVYVCHNPLSYTSQKEYIPTMEERGVEVDYDTKGKVTLDTAGPPTWSYILTHQDGYIYNFFYEEAGITDARVTGEAEEAGWTVEFSSTLVTFSNSNPLTSGSVSGFEITGTQGGTVSWLCGRNSDSIEGPITNEYPRWDVNEDGIVDIFDLVLVGIHFGEDYRNIQAIASMSEMGERSGKTAKVEIDVQNKVCVKGNRLLKVDINIDDVDDLYGCQFNLNFDPKTLKVVGTQAGDILSLDGASTYWSLSEVDNRIGRISNMTYVRKATKDGVSSCGTLANVVFEVKNVSVSDTTILSLSKIRLVDVNTHRFDTKASESLLNWEKLLIPEKTKLLQNYPNPFNPETWIPFKLSDDANVIVSIYDVRGQLIRKIGLGDMPAGVYTSKDRAAYWDGKNSAGERVSSGIYFYQLRAGDYTATKRMLILK